MLPKLDLILWQWRVIDSGMDRLLILDGYQLSWLAASASAWAAWTLIVTTVKVPTYCLHPRCVRKRQRIWQGLPIQEGLVHFYCASVGNVRNGRAELLSSKQSDQIALANDLRG